MTKHRRILNIIEAIRDSYEPLSKVYTEGGCYMFFKILKSIFPEAELWTDQDHAITKIGKYFYDINGVVYQHKEYEPISSYSKRYTKIVLKRNYYEK